MKIVLEFDNTEKSNESTVTGPYTVSFAYIYYVTVTYQVPLIFSRELES